MATIKHWDTEISYTTEDQIRVRGYDLVEMMGTVPFSHVVHLLFTGELPTPEVGRVVDALMVASIDHGPGSPSALATRTAASGGACWCGRWRPVRSESSIPRCLRPKR